MTRDNSMSATFQKKSAGILASVIIGLIILSFLFTGYYTEMGLPTTDVVAVVDREPIKSTEYQRTLEQRLAFFRQMTGGKDLTPQQLEQFGIKQSVLNWLVEQKLLTSFAKRIGLQPGHDEIAEEIKEQPYFKNNNQFDIAIYKELLNRNGLSPADYEKSIGDGISGTRVQQLLNTFPVSESYLKEVISIQENSMKVRAIQMPKDALKKHIDVPENELQNFLQDSKNKEKLEAHFIARKSQLDQPDEAKARHILLRFAGEQEEDATVKSEEEVKKKIEQLRQEVTPKNFAQIADRETQDPSGKGKGGDLGWFGKGRMDLEFEKVVFSLKPGSISNPVKTPFGYHLIYVEEKKNAIPATLETFKTQMAKEILQDKGTDKIKAVEEKVTQELKSILLRNDKAEIEAAEKKYNIALTKDQTINVLDGNIGNISLEPKQLDEIFQEKSQEEKAFVFNTVSNIVVIVTSPESAKPETNLAKQLEEEEKKQQTYFAGQFRKSLIDYLTEKASIKTYPELL